MRQKPTQKDLLTCISRGGRVFLFEYPMNREGDYSSGSFMPTSKAQEEIEEHLFNDVPGCEKIDGPYINGMVAITINDTEANAGQYTDEQLMTQIATTFATYWQNKA